MNASQGLVRSVANDLSAIPAFTGALVVRSLGEIEVLHDAGTLYKKGIAAKEAGRYKEAMEMLEKALSVDPEHLNALFELGYCHIATKDIGNFLKSYFDGAINAATERGIWYYKRYFSIRSKSGEPDENDSGAANNLGVLYGILDNDEEEERYFRYACELDDDDATALTNLGSTLLRKNNTDEAVSYFYQAMCADPSYADSYLKLGLLRKKEKEVREAVDLFRSYLENADKNDVWEAGSIKLAKEYIESHTPRDVEENSNDDS
jgi:tetratricopeptide (TPR) repeat protein